MVEIVVQNGDERRTKGKILLERARALHLQGDTRYAVSEEDVSAVGFFRLGTPVIADGRAIGLPRQCPGDFPGATLRRPDLRRAFGDPARARRPAFKFLL